MIVGNGVSQWRQIGKADPFSIYHVLNENVNSTALRLPEKANRFLSHCCSSGTFNPASQAAIHGPSANPRISADHGEEVHIVSVVLPVPMRMSSWSQFILAVVLEAGNTVWMLR